jgi:DNA invertase Pin-like site-specific DNA recombinase
MAGVMAVFAQLERRLIGERTKAALAQPRAAGVRLGRPRIIPDEVEDRAHELKASGASVRRIAVALDLIGRLSNPRVQAMIRQLHRKTRSRP